MKKIIQIGIVINTVLIMSACSSHNGVNPSQNDALTNITDAKKEKKIGFMQKSLDRWLEEEWSPIVERNKTIKMKNLNKSRDFSLQEYVDKSKIYRDNHSSSTKDSHSQMIKSMPVIGN